jgi:hypothetical protein
MSVAHAQADLEARFVVINRLNHHCSSGGRDPTSPTKRDDIATLAVDCGKVLGVNETHPGVP